MSDGPIGGDVGYANPAARDAFLLALDSDDRALTLRLARGLVACGNALPGLTREALGLPVRATYGAAARHVLSLDRPLHQGADGAARVSID